MNFDWWSTFVEWTGNKIADAWKETENLLLKLRDPLENIINSITEFIRGE